MSDEPQHGRAACRHVEVCEKTRAACTAAGDADTAQSDREPGSNARSQYPEFAVLLVLFLLRISIGKTNQNVVDLSPIFFFIVGITIQ